MATITSEAHELPWLDELAVPKELDKSDYVFRWDQTTLKAFHAVPGAAWLPRQVLNWKLRFKEADLLGQSVRVSENQFPLLHRIAGKTAEILNMDLPPLYLLEDPQLNAFTFGTDDKQSYIVLTRGLLDAVNSRELAFVIGHEMGHVKSEHVLYHTLALWLFNKGLLPITFPFIGELALFLTKPAQLALKAWSRRSEITADRAGLLCCQDLEAAQRTLALLSLGSSKLGREVNIEELKKQPRKDWIAWIRECSYGHPYLHKRLDAIELFAKSDFYKRRIENSQGDFITPEDLDANVERLLGDRDLDAVEFEREFDDTDQLIMMMAFAAAWEDGKVSDDERQVLRSYLEGLDLAGGDGKTLERFIDAPFDSEALKRKLRYFKGDKRPALAFAFAILSATNDSFTRSQRKFLLSAAEGCGVEKGIAKGLVSSVVKRKEFFLKECDLNICADCSFVFPEGDTNCPVCSLAFSVSARVVDDYDRLLCKECGVVMSVADFEACPMCQGQELSVCRMAVALD